MSMNLTKKGYKQRYIDDKVDEYLEIFGAVAVEGPKWCGKTWTSLNHAKSVCFITDPQGNFQNRTLAELSPDLVLDGDSPRLIWVAMMKCGLCGRFCTASFGTTEFT